MKILIVTYFYPPLNKMASSRPFSWAKYFSNYCDVVVYTTFKTKEDGNLNLVTESFKNVELIETQKLIKTDFNILNKLYWVLKSVILLKDKYDVVISTSGPWLSHSIAMIYKLFHRKVKWIADYRDLWSQNYHSNLYSKSVRTKIHRLLERIIVSQADCITSVSYPLVQHLNNLFPKIRKKVIYNGYEKSFNQEIKANNKRQLTIVYTGTIYKGKRDPHLFFKAVQSLLQRGLISENNIKIIFYGDTLPDLKNKISSYGLEKIIEMPGQVSREESLRAQHESDLLLFLEWNDQRTRGVLTGKIFEYIAANTPILAVGIDNEHNVANLLKNTKTGIVLTNINKIEKLLLDLYHNRIPIFFAPVESEIAKYSRKEQAKVLWKLINDICK